MKFELIPQKLFLKYEWKISRNSSFFKENYYLKLIDQNGSFLSEIAPNIRYGETPERIEQDLDRIKNGLTPLCHSFENAYENIRLKSMLTESKKTFNQELGTDLSSKFQTSISIPIMPVEKLEEYIETVKNFNIFKIKINGTSSNKFLTKIFHLLPNKKFRIDANESFTNLEDYKQFEKLCANHDIEFIEQPFPAQNRELYLKLKPISSFILIADESVEQNLNSDICEQFHGINIKLMKAGGLQRALDLVYQAKKQNLKLMLGCMIESSLGISEALLIAHHFDFLDLDGAILLKDDPYKDLILVDNDLLQIHVGVHQLHEHVHGPTLLL